MRAGELDSIRIGTLRRIPREAIRDFITQKLTAAS